MLSPSFVLKFVDWLNYCDGSWEERGIKDEAPQEAKEAYAEYLRIAEDADKRGIEL